VFDLVAGAILLLVLSPLLLLAACLVKLTSRGPLLFSQQRAGLSGVPFRLYKFRTMRADRTPDPKELVRLDHPDITSVGRALRRLKIDEMPQLVSVLKGEMSLVGPRPTLLDQVAAYDDFRRQRLLVRPGITGLAQINGNTAIPWDQRILFDIAYVRRCSLLLDMAILLRTCWAIPAGEPANPRPFNQTPYAHHVTPPEGYEVKPSEKGSI
jgi:lipopolysaccharide/colanic/teichoic acid biosynthesis glycosyltransferase